MDRTPPQTIPRRTVYTPRKHSPWDHIPPDHTPHPPEGQWDTVGKRAVRILLECFLVITARKQSLRRLCFYTCLSVILFCLSACWDTPPRKQTPPSGSRHPPQEANTPAGSRHPPLRSACWEIRPTSGRYAYYWNAYLFSIVSMVTEWIRHPFCPLFSPLLFSIE